MTCAQKRKRQTYNVGQFKRGRFLCSINKKSVKTSRLVSNALWLGKCPPPSLKPSSPSQTKNLACTAAEKKREDDKWWRISTSFYY